jgi:hypothetical protein
MTDRLSHCNKEVFSVVSLILRRPLFNGANVTFTGPELSDLNVHLCQLLQAIGNGAKIMGAKSHLTNLLLDHRVSKRLINRSWTQASAEARRQKTRRRDSNGRIGNRASGKLVTSTTK